MAQARIDVLREVRAYGPGAWQLCLQWCRYRYDELADIGEPVQYGYRFIWRRPNDGSLQAARGQARIPSIAVARKLMDEAEKGGWGDRDGDTLQETAQRLRKIEGCVVDLSSGYVGWESKEVAAHGRLTQDMINDSRLIQAWTS